MRIGLVGTDSSHTDQFVRLLNRDNRYPGTRVVAVSGGDPVRIATLCHDYELLKFEDPVDMLDLVDGVIVGARDAGLHYGHAHPFVAAGRPVFIDKPLTLNLKQARDLCKLARQSGSAITSASALRWQTGMAELRNARHEAPVTIEVTGTFYPDSAYGGAFFYGVHSVEMAQELAGPDFNDVVVQRLDPRTIEVRYRNDTAEVILRLVTPEPDADAFFAVSVKAASSATFRQIVLQEDYMAPVLDRFIEMAASGRQPLSIEQLLAPVALLEVIDAQLRQL